MAFYCDGCNREFSDCICGSFQMLSNSLRYQEGHVIDSRGEWEQGEISVSHLYGTLQQFADRIAKLERLLSTEENEQT